MKTEIITCDCCAKVIHNATWEDAPGLVVFQFGPPEQANITTALPHVCYRCRQILKQGVSKMIALLKPATTEAAKPQ